jgi:hypothetical protein
MPTSHADRARLAHRVLRLREAGLDSDTKLKQAAAEAAKHAASTPAPQGNEVIRLLRAGKTDEARALAEAHVVTPTSSLPALGAIAQHVLNAIDPEADGFTDRALVAKLFNREQLGDVWEEWNDASTAHLEDTLSAGALKEWRASVERDHKATVEAWEAVGFTEQDVHPYFGHGRHLDGAANALYDLGRQGFLEGSIDWDTANTKVALVDSAVYTVNLATHQFMSSVASVVATTAAQASKTVTAGVADAADDTFTAVSGAQSEALIVYQSSAVGGGADVANTLQRLIAYIDTATGLPVTPNGGNITVTWDNGANRIFKL